MMATKTEFAMCVVSVLTCTLLVTTFPSTSAADGSLFSVTEVVQKSGAPKYGLVCPITHRVCFQQCYDPYEEECIDERIACLKGQLRCGNSGCYSPDQKNCLNSTTSRGSAPGILCGLGELLCDGKCFNPESHHCAQDSDGRWHWICPLTQKLCGEYKCYDPTIDACVGGGRFKQVCPIGQYVCDYDCYHPETHTCFNDTAKGRSYSYKDQVLCSAGEAACGVRCYNVSATEKAGMRCTENGAICPLGQEGCNRYTCYSPEAGETCHSYGKSRASSRRRKRGLKCDAGHESCGWECYDPEIEACFPEAGNNICWKGREPCGNPTCYWPHNETCYEDQLGYSAHSCPNELSACGYKCFDPKVNTCHDGGRARRILCGLNEKRCSYNCYDPTKQVCSGRRETLCSLGQEACGTICYKPNKGLTCYDERILCKNGKLGCGCKCYDPKTQTCNMVPNGNWIWSD